MLAAVTVLVVLTAVGTFVAGLLSAPVDFGPAAQGPAGASWTGPVLAGGRGGAQLPAVQIPSTMRSAIIAAEDPGFLRREALNPLGGLRAAFRQLTGGSAAGSTLTERYVASVYVGTQRRPVREWALAVRLDRQRNRQQILTAHLNTLFLGNGQYGVQAAAGYYFGVPARDLGLDLATGRRSRILEIARAALLAGIAPDPAAWNPATDRGAALTHQRETLNQMVRDGDLSPVEASQAYALDVPDRLASAPGAG